MECHLDEDRLQRELGLFSARFENFNIATLSAEIFAEAKRIHDVAGSARAAEFKDNLADAIHRLRNITRIAPP
jgi:hypothetical protein